MTFAKEMIELKAKLEKLGHEVVVPKNLDKYVNESIKVEDKWDKLHFDVFREYFEEIKNSDAIIVVNNDKNGVKGYIGGNSLIEMAFAHVLNKKIFLINQIPKMSYTDEIDAMKPVIIGNNLDKLKH